MSMIDDESPGVHVVRAGEGPATWLVGDTYTSKATTESTGGAFALVEASVPPGGGPPPPPHHPQGPPRAHRRRLCIGRGVRAAGGWPAAAPAHPRGRGVLPAGRRAA